MIPLSLASILQESAEAVQWHMGCVETLAPTALIPLRTSIAGSQHATSSGGASESSKQLLKWNLLVDFWLPTTGCFKSAVRTLPSNITGVALPTAG